MVANEIYYRNLGSEKHDRAYLEWPEATHSNARLELVIEDCEATACQFSLDLVSVVQRGAEPLSFAFLPLISAQSHACVSGPPGKFRLPEDLQNK